MPEKSILDARLAEIDRRLRTIQSGLAPTVEADPAQSPSMARVVPPDAAPVHSGNDGMVSEGGCSMSRAGGW